MGFRLRIPLIGLLFLTLALSSALADNTRDRTQFGHDINVGPDESIGDVTCFGCSVRVRGHVTTDVTVFGGSVTIEDQGQIGGDATVFGGGVRLEKQARVGGDVTVFGGRIHRDGGTTIGGDVTNFAGSIWLLLIFGLPVMLFAGFIALIVLLVRRLTRPSVPLAA
ncbi:MAG TPA: hypothetical protein VMR80_01190 [Candidatus Acidoferrum sp.]|nr:hypothetical protein [Candidatus Acidoferrum sp.]